MKFSIKLLKAAQESSRQRCLGSTSRSKCSGKWGRGADVGKVLDPELQGNDAREFENELCARLIGQKEAVKAVVHVIQVLRAGLNSPGRPVGNLLFLGPTGSGKTRIVEAAAEILFGDARAVIKIDCAEFQESHEIAKLIGSPPGYAGHGETPPVITEEALAASFTDKLKLSFLLFDEIEKASDALWQLLLGMLDKATLTLGDNRKVDLSQTVIFLTSNLGAGEISELMQGGMGFIQPKDKLESGLYEKMERAALGAARRKFPPEFMNRLDKVVVFHPLMRKQLEEVLDIELGQVQRRVLDTAKGQFLFRVTTKGKEFLLREGTDERYGARHLKRAIEHYLVYPMANLMVADQVKPGDVLQADWNLGQPRLTFTSETEGGAIPATTETAQRAASEIAYVSPQEGTTKESREGIIVVPPPWDHSPTGQTILLPWGERVFIFVS